MSRRALNALPIQRDLTLAYRVSLVVAVLMAVASVAGLALGAAGLCGTEPKAVGVTEAEAGLLVPGLLDQDTLNLVVGVPLLLGSIWLARRGSLAGLLLAGRVLLGGRVSRAARDAANGALKERDGGGDWSADPDSVGQSLSPAAYPHA